MLIRNFLKTLVNRRKLNARCRLARPLDLSEQLESRTLLTGNVQVSLIGSNAQITGDAANNEIEVVVNNGSVVVRGLNGTTVNQGSTAFTLANASTMFHGSLTASLGAGDDVATIGPGITFAGNVSVSGNGGADTLRALTGTYNGNLSLMAGDGASSIVVDGATVSGVLSVNGQGAMVVSITNSTVRGQLDVAAGLENSPDSVVIKGTTVDKKTSIVTGKGNDNVVLQNSHFNGQLILHTGAGDDVVYIDSSSVGRLALIATQRGDDTLQILNNSSFSRLLLFAGGLGHDAANIASDTSTHAVIKASQDPKYFNATTVATRITDPTTGAIAIANNLLTAAVPKLTVTTSVSSFAENAGVAAATLTVTRTGPTAADQIVTLTSSDSTKATVPATVTILAGSTSATVTIAAVDNTTVDGAKSVTFTATATGFANATAVVTVTDNETALSLSSSPATFSEAAGATASTLTVTRTGSTTAAQVVTLISSNTAKATVPATVTIPAGSTSATVTIAAVDNTTADGNFTVTITASATGFANATTDLTVIDNETALTVTANPAVFSENAGTNASTLTVTRTGATTAAQIVTLTSSNTLKATVPATVTIPAGSTTATVVVAAVDNTTVDGATTVTITAVATGFTSGTTNLTVNDNETALSLSAVPSTFAESAGATASTLTVTRTGPSTAAQVVNLRSSNTNAATVPATVTIPAGSTTATVSIAALNNPAVTGPVSVVITATATGFADTTTTLTVNDVQTVLSLSASPATFSENAGTAASTLTVTRTGPTTAALVVSLSSSDESHAKASLPTVTIPIGQTSATTTISAIDDQKVNVDAAVTITAAATGFANATKVVTVANTNVPALTVTSNVAIVSETAGSTSLEYTVTRNTTDNSLPLTVNLSSNLTARLGVPATAIIAAGATSATFLGTPVNDTIVNGNSLAVVTASATGFVAGTSTVTITDNDAGTLALTSSAASIAENAGADALTFTITRTSSNITQPLVLTLSSSNTSRLTVGNTVTIPANQTSVTFKGTPVDNMLVDAADDVVVTAVAVGFNNATKTVTINNTDVPTLTVTSNAATVAENAASGTLVYTVSRNTTANRVPLTVNLSSGTVSRLTVGSSVTIPAGATSVTFVGSPVNNTVADGNAPVIVTASASGFVNGTKSVTVNDDEMPTLALTANLTSVFENAGAAAVTYTVTRNTSDLTSPLTVTLTSGTPSRLTVEPTVTIPAGAAFVTFPGTPIDNTVVDGNAAVVVTAAATAFTSDTVTVTVKDNDTLALSVTPPSASIAENATPRAFFYTVSRNTSDLTQALIVNLTSNNTTRLGVPATVTIPVGAKSIFFEVAPVNNSVADGNVNVTLTASTTGFATATWTVNVLDDEATTPAPTLTATLSVASLSENAPAGSTFLSVTRNTSDTTQTLLVNLTYSDSSRVSGPATITIPANQTSVSVPVSTINNTIVDGDITEDISATATGFKSSQTTLTVKDDDTATLSITTAASTVPETAGTLTGTVTTSRASSAPIVVKMAYQFPAVLTGPAVVVIPAGATSVPITFTVNNGSVVIQNVVSEIFADAFGAVSGMATVTITDADTMALTATPTTADKVQSNGTIITRNAIAQVTGTTTAGATISIDSNGDGVFDNGTATAGSNGTYSVNVNVTNTATNHGENHIVVRADHGTLKADTAVDVHLAVGTVVHFATNVGAYDVELLDSAAGATVTNFLSYVTSGAYQNMFVHRANAGGAKFIQGGGFKVSGSQITDVATNAPIANQFNPANGNVAGTLAMALTAASINSGTSGWFVNAIDNSAGFDPGKYTVFGRVIGDGLTVVKQISDLSQANLNTLYSSSALASVPLTAIPANTSITGTVATTSGSAILTGTGTLFTSQLTVGESVVLGSGKAFFVSSIQSNTSLTLTQSVTSTASGLAVKKHVVPTDAEFVVFSSIGKILDTL